MGKKIYISIILFVIIGAIVTGIFFVIKNIEDSTPFIPNSDIQMNNIKKYETKLLAEYEKEGKQEQFLKLAKHMQEKSLAYVLESVTESEDSFNKNLKAVQEIYKKKEFSKLDINYDETNYWVGTWLIDEKGNVKFEFASNSIKPSWTANNSISNYLVK